MKVGDTECSAIRYILLTLAARRATIFANGTSDPMIKSWKTEAARMIFEGRKPGKGFPSDLIAMTRRRLFRLNDAISIEDLRVPPGHRLHMLDADRAGQWSISVKDQFRICFRWGEKGPEDVEFTDYH